MNIRLPLVYTIHEYPTVHMQAPAGYAIKADPALVSIDDTAPSGTMESDTLTLMHGM